VTRRRRLERRHALGTYGIDARHEDDLGGRDFNGYVAAVLGV